MTKELHWKNVSIGKITKFYVNVQSDWNPFLFSSSL